MSIAMLAGTDGRPINLMTLTKKTALYVTATVILMLSLNVVLMNRHTASTFGTYEDEGVEQNAARVLQAINATYEAVDPKDYAGWTDLYDFLRGDYPDFLSTNLTDGVVANLGADLLIVAEVNGNIGWVGPTPLRHGRAFHEDGSFMPPHLAERTSNAFDASRVLYRGLLSTSIGPMLIASRPVVRTDGSGPPAGSIIMGKLIDEQWTEHAKSAFKVDFALHPISHATPLSDKLQTIAGSLASGANASLVKKQADVVQDYRLLYNLADEPALLIETITPRFIWNQGRQLRWFNTISIIVTGLVILLVIAACLRRLVARPLNKLTTQIGEIEVTGEIPEIEEVKLTGEIGELARRFESLIKSRMTAEETATALLFVIDRIPKPLAIADADFRIEYSNSAFHDFARACGTSKRKLVLRELFSGRADSTAKFDDMRNTILAGDEWKDEFSIADEGGGNREYVMLVSPLVSLYGSLSHLLISCQDVTSKNSAARQLQESRRLESVGQLAAGVAHEINTPIQFVGDNTAFLKESFAEIKEMLEQLIKLTSGQKPKIEAKAVRSLLEEIDAEYLIEEIPTAIDQSIGGIDRVATIVRAMKAFSHPGKERTEVDINRAIESTVTVASNEWKYVAEMQLDLADNMPLVFCDAGQLNQVILNMIVNASHALADAGKGQDGETLGKIRIHTRAEMHWIEIGIADDGAGMPDSVKERIFDPFFTTKAVGKGTGQGLSIAYDVIVNKHDGKISVESEPGAGTTFIIRLPVRAKAEDEATVAKAV